MSELNESGVGRVWDRAEDEWRERVAPAIRSATGGLSPGLVLGGLAALGLAFLAWRHFGPDVRRYIKMESM